MSDTTYTSGNENDLTFDKLIEAIRMCESAKPPEPVAQDELLIINSDDAQKIDGLHMIVTCEWLRITRWSPKGRCCVVKQKCLRCRAPIYRDKGEWRSGICTLCMNLPVQNILFVHPDQEWLWEMFGFGPEDCPREYADIMIYASKPVDVE